MTGRIIKNVSKARQSELNLLFPNIIEQVYGYKEDMPGYSWVAISIFDHWLFSDEHHLINEVPVHVNLERLQLLHSFTRKLVEETEVLTFRCRGKRKDKVKFKSFTSDKAANIYCESSTESTPINSLYVIILPKYKCIINESRDYTNHLYYRDKELVSPLLQMVNNHGLKTIKEMNRHVY